jgi:Tol biopolymer transport system component/tRNA A-37 threonylcarbamoyl transferase component Bud32
MSVAVGSSLSQYEITALLGEGGMGTVYRARDKKLKRDVAIKILPDEFARDPDRVERFQREAEALASLSHTNIAAIHDLQEAGDTTFLVLELVEGDTLDQLLKKRGPLPLPDALAKAQQMCSALEAAHDKGIVHRDLKPANVKIAPNGTLKLLDFGIASMRDPMDGSVDAHTMTRSRISTLSGNVMGTPAYMAPEQVLGEALDSHTDIWAFGCVLYELLTGTAPFRGATIADTFAAIVGADPDWRRLPAATPTAIRALLRQCLQKDRRRRLAHIADARIWIDDTIANPAPASDGVVAGGGARPRRWWWAGWATAALAAAALGVVTAYYSSQPPAPQLRVQINTPAMSDGFSLALSPDARRLVFPVAGGGKAQLWMRALDSLNAAPLPGTDGATFPFWSPNGASVGFFADGQLKRADIVGGVPVVLVRTPLGRGATWNQNDIIVYAPSGTGPLFKIPATGGEPVAVTKVEAGHMSHRFPQFLPDGEHFIFFAAGSSPGIYVGSLSGGPAKRILNTEASGVVTASGFLFFVREGALFAQRFDLTTHELRDQPVPVAEQVAVDSGAFLGGFTAQAGVVAFRTGGAGGRRQLTWFDRTGKIVDTVGAPDTAVLTGAEVSPDGRRVAVNRLLNGNLDIWLIELTKGALSRLTFDPTLDAWPHWTPDGERIVYSSNVKGNYNLYERSASGGGSSRLLVDSDQAKIPQDVSPDGQLLIYASLDPQSAFDLWTLPLSGASTPTVFLKTPFQESDAQFSPDGRWVAYHSNESGRYEVYVQPLNEQQGRIQVSTGGGAQPRWRRDTKEIFYVSLDSRIMAASVTPAASGNGLEFGTPGPLFAVDITGGPILLNNTQHYWASRDGQRFLINVSIDPTPPITLLYNWNPTTTR